MSFAAGFFLRQRNFLKAALRQKTKKMKHSISVMKEKPRKTPVEPPKSPVEARFSFW